ncbi:MAG: TonB-dependent receptor [Chitinophagaceae bacterium]
MRLLLRLKGLPFLLFIVLLVGSLPQLHAMHRPEFYGQKEIPVSGKITNATGEAIAGASVQVKGSTLGTSSNESGEFHISVPENAVLVFSMVGYERQELAVSGQLSVNVQLVTSVNSMNEVIVVGYGTQKKMNVTGAVDQLSGKDIAKRPVANVFQGLQGLSPGLNISYPGGRPGATPTINVRGAANLQGNASPLIVIDGIASTADDLLRISPADIASITVLRDAASAAIYGARASFGVILITTRQGSTGHQRISYNNYFASSRSTVLPKQITDPYIYSRVLETSTDNTPWDYVNYTDYQYQWAKDRSNDPSVEDTRVDPNDPTKWIYMGSNNWNDFFFNKSNISQNHNLSFSGGSDMGNGRPFTYLLSADYTDENGLNKLARDDWKRYGLRARISFTPLKGLKLDNNLNIYQTIGSAPSQAITDLYYLQPTQVAVNPDGTWANSDAGRLGAKLTSGGRAEQNRFGFQDVIRGTLSLLNNDLQIVGNASIKRELWRANRDFRKYKIGYGPGDVREEGGTDSVSVRNGNVKHDVYDLYATYKKSLGDDHDFSIVAGYNQEEYIYTDELASRSGLVSVTLPYLGATTGTAAAYADYSTYALRSLFGRLHYEYKQRYIVEVNGRRDGSSRFPSERRQGFFPSVSAAWVASQEPFMESVTKIIPTMKFRASYGDLGNQGGNVQDFGYIQTLTPVRSPYLIDNGYPTVIGGAPALKVDPDTYTWEKVRTFNLGTDLGFLNNKLQFGFDYFVRKTIGMLAAGAELPAVIGTTPPLQNVADLETKGFELTLGYRDHFNVAAKPLNFGARFILSDSRSKVTRFNNQLQTLKDFRVGQEIGEIWGLENDGYFASAEEIAKLDQSAIIPWDALEVVAGWPRYVDQNGDGKITLGQTATEPGDLKKIGNSSPRFRFGFNLDLDWNNFDFSMFLQGVVKQDFYPHHYLFWGPYQQPYAGIYAWNLDYYRGVSETGPGRDQHSASYLNAGLADANLDSYFPVLQSWLADNNYGTGLDLPQTKYMLNAAYLRVKNLTIGYTIPASVTKRFNVSRLRVYVTGENLFEFSEVKKYFDPEAIADGYGLAYPFQRKYAFGINLDF